MYVTMDHKTSHKDPFCENLESEGEKKLHYWENHL